MNGGETCALRKGLPTCPRNCCPGLETKRQTFGSCQPEWQLKPNSSRLSRVFPLRASSSSCSESCASSLRDSSGLQNRDFCSSYLVPAVVLWILPTRTQVAKEASNKGFPLRTEVLPPGTTSQLNTTLSVLGDDLLKPPFACLGI